MNLPRFASGVQTNRWHIFAHHHAGVLLDPKQRRALPEHIEKALAVFVIEEHVLAVVPAVGDVVPKACVLEAEWSCHGVSVAE